LTGFLLVLAMIDLFHAARNFRAALRNPFHSFTIH
jgi:hypothetical protein